MKVLKKVLLGALSLACVTTASVGLVGCGAGKDGKDGKSAYEIWLANGYSGTEADFLEWLKADGTMQAQEGTDGLAYYPLPDGTYAVGQGNTMYLEEIVIPSTYKGKAVTVLADNAFSSEKLKSITIPDSVTSIGGGVFSNCRSLTSVVIPDSVTSIGDFAFLRCSSLTSVVIGDSVTSIGAQAFWECSSLTSVACPAFAISYIPQDNLQTVVITSGESIDEYAFSNCRSLTSVVIADCVTSIGSGVFYFCENLTSVVIGDSVTSIAYAMFYFCGSLTSVVIPDSVTSIGGGVFSYCSSLTGVVVGDSVTSIGDYAFDRCSSLTSVYYKGSVSDWGEIDISLGNECLTSATLYYYSESQPTEEGNYWHYDKNGEVAVW